MMLVVYPGYCLNCGRKAELSECRLGRETIDGGERIFFICPYCGKELENEVKEIKI